MRESTEFLGTSAAIDSLREEIQLAARSDAKVLITGESGVGKEIAAQRIHAQSSRSGLPLVTINCAGVPDTLLESELFGHVKGSFTGAYRDKPGLVEIAHDGTLFLDEVGEMSLRMQGVLLRFLETGELQRVGSHRMEHRVDVRIIAATNRDLLERVAARTFREDLYYRMNVIHLRVPPLRERPGDIPVFLTHFLAQFSRQYRTEVPRMSDNVVAALAAYAWPGNVRELRNVMERLVVRSHGTVISLKDVPPEIIVAASSQAAAPRAEVVKDARSRAEMIYDNLKNDRLSFWSTVYAPFMSRDLTRDDIRAIVTMGLEECAGNYRVLVSLFNVDASDYKRFLNFLRKHQCHVPFQPYRTCRPASGLEEPVADAAYASIPAELAERA
jgi:transcriptional regulator with PAS, ATPase and Fis domain